MPNRNKAPLAILINPAPLNHEAASPKGQEAVVNSSQNTQANTSYLEKAAQSNLAMTQAVTRVRDAAEKANPEYGKVAQETEFIRGHDLTNDQVRRIIEASKRNAPNGELNDATDRQVMILVSEALKKQGALNIYGSGIVLYDPDQFIGYAPESLDFVIAHELGHNILRNRGEANTEKGADHIGAEIVGPQKAIGALADTARIDPSTNNAKAQEDAHGTDYQRALDIQKDFPKSKVDLSNFPKPDLGVDKFKGMPSKPLGLRLSSPCA